MEFCQYHHDILWDVTDDISSVSGKQMSLYATKRIVLGVIGKGKLIAAGGYGGYSVNCGKKIPC